MKIFLICIIPVLFFSAGCQSNREKGAMRCLYDQSVFADAIARAINDEELFNMFKRDPFYALVFQGYSYEEGLAILENIEKECPFLIAAFEHFRTSDRIGGPKTFDYGKYGMFSPTTLHHAWVAGNVIRELTSLPCAHIVQIGAGYGGLCKILNDLQAWKTYTLIDLPEHLALAKRVLDEQGVRNVHFLTPQEVTKGIDCDLVISDLSFSEFSRPMQQLFIDRVFVGAQAGFLLGHTFPKHFGVESFSPHVFKGALEKMKQHVHVEMAEAHVERTDYTLSWRSSS